MQARRMRKAMEHVIRSTVVRSRAARYQTEVEAFEPKQATIPVRRYEQHHERLQPCPGYVGMSCGAKQQVLHSPRELQLPAQITGTEKPSWGLLSANGPESDHVSWSDDARPRSADSVSAGKAPEKVSTAVTPPGIAEHEVVQYNAQSESPGLSDTHDNVLFEGAWSEGDPKRDTSQEIFNEFQTQMEIGLQSMQLELQRFKADIVTQLNGLQTANAGRNGTRARSQRTSART